MLPVCSATPSCSSHSQVRVHIPTFDALSDFFVFCNTFESNNKIRFLTELNLIISFQLIFS